MWSSFARSRSKLKDISEMDQLETKDSLDDFCASLRERRAALDESQPQPSVQSKDSRDVEDDFDDCSGESRASKRLGGSDSPRKRSKKRWGFLSRKPRVQDTREKQSVQKGEGKPKTRRINVSGRHLTSPPEEIPDPDEDGQSPEAIESRDEIVQKRGNRERYEMLDGEDCDHEEEYGDEDNQESVGEDSHRSVDSSASSDSDISAVKPYRRLVSTFAAAYGARDDSSTRSTPHETPQDRVGIQEDLHDREDTPSEEKRSFLPLSRSQDASVPRSEPKGNELPSRSASPNLTAKGKAARDESKKRALRSLGHFSPDSGVINATKKNARNFLTSSEKGTLGRSGHARKKSDPLDHLLQDGNLKLETFSSIGSKASKESSAKRNGVSIAKEIATQTSLPDNDEVSTNEIELQTESTVSERIERVMRSLDLPVAPSFSDPALAPLVLLRSASSVSNIVRNQLDESVNGIALPEGMNPPKPSQSGSLPPVTPSSGTNSATPRPPLYPNPLYERNATEFAQESRSVASFAYRGNSRPKSSNDSKDSSGRGSQSQADKKRSKKVWEQEQAPNRGQDLTSVLSLNDVSTNSTGAVGSLLTNEGKKKARRYILQAQEYLKEATKIMVEKPELAMELAMKAFVFANEAEKLVATTTFKNQSSSASDFPPLSQSLSGVSIATSNSLAHRLDKGARIKQGRNTPTVDLGTIRLPSDGNSRNHLVSLAFEAMDIIKSLSGKLGFSRTARQALVAATSDEVKLKWSMFGRMEVETASRSSRSNKSTGSKKVSTEETVQAPVKSGRLSKLQDQTRTSGKSSPWKGFWSAGSSASGKHDDISAMRRIPSSLSTGSSQLAVDGELPRPQFKGKSKKLVESDSESESDSSEEPSSASLGGTTGVSLISRESYGVLALFSTDVWCGDADKAVPSDDESWIYS